MTPLTAPAWKRSTVVTDDGARLATYVHEPEGAHDEMPTLVVAHGWTLSHRSWDPVVERLGAQQPVRIVAWDQRGHGASTLSNGRYRVGGESMRSLGDDLVAVVDAAVPPASPLVLAGHSMGGMTILACASGHPDVVRERVRSVVLVSTSAGKLKGLGLPLEEVTMKLLSRVPLRPGRLVLADSQRRFVFGDGARHDDVRAVRDQIAATRLSTLAAFHGPITTLDEVRALEVLGELPVTILVGGKDKLTPPSHSHALAEAMPGAHLEIVEGAGHMLMYEATDEVYTAIIDALAHTL